MRKEVPQGTEVCEKQLFALVDKVHNVDINEEQIAPFLPKIMESMEDLSKEDIIKRFASLEFNRFLEYYQNAPDLNIEAREGAGRERGDRDDRRSRQGSKGYTRLFMNLGSVDEFSRGDMLGFICNTAKISGKSIGKIDLKGVFTFFEVEDAEVNRVFDGFKDIDFNGRQVRIEVSGEGGGRSEGGRGGRPRGGDRGPRSGGGDRRDRNRGERSGGGSRGGERREGGFRDFSGKRQGSRSKY